MSTAGPDFEFESLFKSARGGCESGLGGLLESFRPLLAQIARRSLAAQIQTRMSESDLVQETMLTASQRFCDFRGTSKSEMQAWLTQILQTRLIDGLRRHVLAERRRIGLQKSESFRTVIDDAGTPSSQASLNEQSAMLIRAISELPEINRAVLLMRYVEQLGFEEIAQRTGVPLATVWRHWSRSIEKLRKQLGHG